MCSVWGSVWKQKALSSWSSHSWIITPCYTVGVCLHWMSKCIWSVRWLYPRNRNTRTLRDFCPFTFEPTLKHWSPLSVFEIFDQLMCFSGWMCRVFKANNDPMLFWSFYSKTELTVKHLDIYSLPFLTLSWFKIWLCCLYPGLFHIWMFLYFHQGQPIC